jgi:hypothetical protein
MYKKTETQAGKYISVKRASEIVGRTTSELELLCRGGKVHSKIMAGEWYITESSLSEYFNMSLASVVPLTHLVEKENISIQEALSTPVPFSVILGKAVNILAAFTLVFGGYYTVGTVEGRSAGMQVVGYVQRALDRSTDTMALAGYGILGMFQDNYSSNNLLTLETSAFSKKQTQPSKSSGLLVTPSTGESDKDKTIREQIQNSFSDKVEVIPDKGGKSGIIKPVFKKTSGKSYMYVMVPVED